MKNGQNLTIIGALIAIIGFGFQLTLQNLMRPYAPDGFYFQGWSSEAFMQTVSIQDLRDEPIESLLNIHIQPPGFDAIRAILVHFSSSSDIHLALKEVDSQLYVLWAILYSLVGTIIFLWTARLTRVGVGIVAGFLFLLHPASIFYATLLDTTILTTFLVLWAYYLLWQTKAGNQPVAAYTGVTLALFFTRSIFQLPFILVLGLCLLLIKAPKQKVLAFTIITLGLGLAYTLKQYYQFHIFSTSSFTGYNLTRSVGIEKQNAVHPDFGTPVRPGLADVLTRQTKLTGDPNYNNINYLVFNDYLTKKYAKYLLKLPVGDLLRNYLDNLKLYWLPSSKYARETNVIVERLPWRRPYDIAFSFPIFPALLMAACILAGIRTIRQNSYAASTAMFLPGLALFLISVVFEKGENMRFKFFMEPVFYVFIISEFYNGATNYLRKTPQITPVQPSVPDSDSISTTGQPPLQ